MWGSSRFMHRRVLLLAVAFVLIQTYVLYSSTFHVFHNMAPMCAACEAIKSYQGGIVDNPNIVLNRLKYFFEEATFSPQFTQLELAYFNPRAPPYIYS